MVAGCIAPAASGRPRSYDVVMEPSAPKIKFCGLTDPADAERAVAAGAWALGMIMWPGSPRHCDLGAAFRRQA